MWFSIAHDVKMIFVYVGMELILAVPFGDVHTLGLEFDGITIAS